jgi:hypothetical protein
MRDLDSDQSLFWSVAVPLTVVVMALAFIYGYKGDEIVDWFSDKMHDRRKRQRNSWQSTSLPSSSLSQASTTVPELDSSSQKVNQKTGLRHSLFRRKRDNVKRVKTSTGFTADSYP